MSTRSTNFISPAQREKIAEALDRAAAARRRANGATRGLKKMLAGLTKSDDDLSLPPSRKESEQPDAAAADQRQHRQVEAAADIGLG